MSTWPPLTSEELYVDPNPFYARSHRQAPMRWDPGALGVGAWMVASHGVAASCLKDPRLSADRSLAYRLFLPAAEDGVLLGDLIAGSLAFRDPPDHTRLRRLVSKVFTPRAVAALRPRIEAMVDEHLAAAGASGELELMSGLALPLPVTVVCELLGVPVEDSPRLKPLIDDYALFFGAIKGLKRALVAAPALSEYFMALIDERRARPRADLLSALIAAEEEVDRLSPAELLHFVIFLFIAGYHTTTNLIGNGMLALLRNPAELAWLQTHPDGVPKAIEELLRFDSPVHLVARVATERMEIGGQMVEAGQIVVCMIGAANRDPLVFAEPDRLDLERDNARQHLAFGGGAHFCIGAPLARLEGEIAFRALLSRFSRIDLAGSPVWFPNLNLRGMRSLPLRVCPS